MEGAVEHEVRIAAQPETAFAHFTDADRLVRWMGSDATIDPRPGGAFRVTVTGEPMVGEFVQVDPPWRLVLRWGWAHELFGVGPRSTAVEVSFTPDGEGTLVRLAHRRLPRGACGFHGAGWEHYLPRLVIAAGGGDPGSDPWDDLELPARALGLAAAEPRP